MSAWVIRHDGIERRGRWVRRLAAERITRVHTFTEQDGRQALVFRARHRAWGVTDDHLVDPELRRDVTELVRRLDERGIEVDRSVDQLLDRLAG